MIRFKEAPYWGLFHAFKVLGNPRNRSDWHDHFFCPVKLFLLSMFSAISGSLLKIKGELI
jgi:hypothetical protein